ncbi:TonB-dependent receptor plug domain-containing protein [Chitinimonas sp. BJB300]|uniref:TonB-dependent receptor plug domain-containing protein n=1 Tax=Chitinimonas sp. BJB300 TaxID=1559339 RepID=UPI0013046686|nr:TonB-dependent receptor [Chitinimonas sp. BJB300]
MKKKYLAIAVATLSSTDLAFSAEVSQAQRAEKIEITGSNIKRLNRETQAPVQVIRREEIKQTGANTLRQLLDTISAADLSAISDVNSGKSFASGASGLALRGMGKRATLTLVNGRRISHYALADGAKENFVNIDTIPTEVIDRVEILKDGASAIYGSDAIAGVVNIITRKTYSGLSATASAQHGVDRNVGAQHTATVTAGTGDLAKDGYNVFGHLDLYRREGYTQADILGAYPDWHTTYVNPALRQPHSTSYPGNLFDPANGVARQPMYNCPAAQVIDGACKIYLNEQIEIISPAKRVNVHSGARFTFNPDLRGFGELSYSRTQNTYRLEPYAFRSAMAPAKWLNGLTGEINSMDYPTLAVGNPANPYTFPVGIEYRFMDDVSLFKRDVTSNQYRLLAGLEGSVGKWDWNAAVGRVGADTDSSERGSPSARELTRLITSGEYRIGERNSDEVLARLFPHIGMTGNTYQNFVDGKISGEIMDLPAGPLAIALGFDLREESLKISSSENVQRAEIVNRGGFTVDGRRQLSALFAELNIPVVKNLEVSAAARYDKAGANDRISPKVGFRFHPVRNLLLRGTYAEGFRAPNIPEQMAQGGLTGRFHRQEDPRRCATATEIRNALRTGNATDINDANLAFNSGCNVEIPVIITANPAIQPETSTSKSLGFVFEPNRHFSLAADYFTIERKNEIRNRLPPYVLKNEGKPNFETALDRQAISAMDLYFAQRASQLTGQSYTWDVGQVQRMSLQYENLFRTRVSGIDIDADSRFNLASIGRVGVGLEATYMIKHQTYDVEANKWQANLIGRYAYPRLRATLKTSLTRGPWSTSLRFHYMAGTTLYSLYDENSYNLDGCAKKGYPAQYCKIGSDLRTDLTVTYSGFKNLTAGINVFNLLGRDSPVDMRNGFIYRDREVKLAMGYEF